MRALLPPNNLTLQGGSEHPRGSVLTGSGSTRPETLRGTSDQLSSQGEGELLTELRECLLSPLSSSAGHSRHLTATALSCEL